MKSKPQSILFLPTLSIIFISAAAFFLYPKLKSNKTISTKIALANSSCITCHANMQGFAPAHTPDKISCTSCHLGNEMAIKKEAAHENMLLIPGNLSNASETCAKCHPGIALRVKNSIMNTMSGVVSIDKYIFGENDNLDSLFNIHNLKNDSPADNHLRNKCASCHLGREKLETKPIHEKSRGGGCTACHLNYSEAGKKTHDKYISSEKEDLTTYHPSLSLQVTDNHCFGCHSRSGRISTNYEGWHETLLKQEDVSDFEQYRVLEDKRVFVKKTADIHHTKGLSCIDCHDANDTMGNGISHPHKEEAVNIDCRDCHNTTKVKTVPFAVLDAADKSIIRLKNIDSSLLFLYTSISEKPLLNVVKEEGYSYLITKFSAQKYRLTPPAENCTKDAHKNISCSTCHTTWAPQCISCHTSYDEDIPGYDLLARKKVAGKWAEKGDNYLADFPTLGIVTEQGKKTVKTFSPGMIMTLQKVQDGKSSFHRFFAPGSAHTISAKGRTCKECHNNPVALGYGRGDLIYTKKGTWKFKPLFTNDIDGLPQDAWIPFLKNDIEDKATRKNARPFNLSEQQNILRVGACLTCHKEGSKVTNWMLNDFEAVLLQVKEACILPEF